MLCNVQRGFFVLINIYTVFTSVDGLVFIPSFPAEWNLKFSISMCFETMENAE